MPTTAPPPPASRDRPSASLLELERLWRAPATGREAAARGLARRPRLGDLLVCAWAATLAVVIFAAPAAENATPPLWTDVVAAGFFATLLGAAIGGRLRPPIGFAGSAAAGALGTVLGVACRATEHHTGAWWIYETASFGALAFLSLAGLARRITTST